MLLELAVGDAYGLGFEFADDAIFFRNNLTQYLPHGLHPIQPGCYSDDAQMALAVAEVILAKGKDASTVDFANGFVLAFRRDPRLGYAKGFHALLSEVQTGEDLLARLKPSSTRGGAAMRVAPIGLFESVEEVKRLAALQARITHDTVQGVESAVAVALLVHAGFHGLALKVDLRRYLVQELGSQWTQPHQGCVHEDGLVIANAALTAVESSASASAILQNAVAFTGDTDTVAAIAMAIASVSNATIQDLPGCLLEGLENTNYGRSYLTEMDQKLGLQFPAVDRESQLRR